ncbi:MAG: nitrophenyl compound nitroreductase subunit ArsF family protein [Candidatus Moranbacteria bacterium]|nr:nitrophenyl compound nitroreductase subunit ArsF family protein [Candidatus Moranbacteria bacterium]
MKKLGIYLLYGGVLFFAIALIYISVGPDKKTESIDTDANVQADNSGAAEVRQTKPAEKVQIYEFHSTNRCYSCITMGQYIKTMVDESFQTEIKSGKLEFREINVDLPENKAVAAKFQAAGTSLFLNAIIDGQDNIQEEAQAWRLLGDQKALSDYLSKKLRGMIGETVSAGTQKEMEKMNITFYSGDNCPNCVNIQKYLADNGVKEKMAFEEKNVDKNETDAEQMAEDAMRCNVDPEAFGVPFLWADGKCYTNEKDIIDLFKQKLN